MNNRTNQSGAAAEGGKSPRESCAACDCYPVYANGNAFGENHVPTPLALIHLQHHTGRSWRVVDGLVHQEKVRSHLQNRKRKAVDQQAHFYVGRMSAAT